VGELQESTQSADTGYGGSRHDDDDDNNNNNNKEVIKKLKGKVTPKQAYVALRSPEG
jgi:hypothetical protein